MRSRNTIFVRTFRFALLSKVTFASWFIAGMWPSASHCRVRDLVHRGAARIAGLRAGLAVVVAERLASLREVQPAAAARRRRTVSACCYDFISTLYNKVPQIFLGKLYPQETLGSYEQAVKLKDQPATSAMQAVQNVTFPALAKIKDDAPKLAESYRQIVMVVAYAMFPVMLGLSAIAEDMFAVFLGGEWMATVPYFEAVCGRGFFTRWGWWPTMC